MWQDQWKTYMCQQRLPLLFKSEQFPQLDEELSFLTSCSVVVKPDNVVFQTNTQSISHNGKEVVIDVKFNPILTLPTIQRFVSAHRKELKMPRLHEDETVDRYLYEISWYPKPNELHVNEFVRQHRDMDHQQKKHLLWSCSHEVVNNVLHIQDSDLDIMDLIQVGNLEMMRALEEYDPRQEFGFLTYLRWRVKQELERKKKLY